LQKTQKRKLNSTVTRGTHYDACATMAVPEPQYLLETAFTSYFLRKLPWVMCSNYFYPSLHSFKRNLFTRWPSTFKHRWIN